VTVQVFGGEVEVRNFFAENLAHPRGGSAPTIAFRNISLEELTRKIEIARCPVWLRIPQAFVMEYGQPASFELEIESTDAPGSIAVDQPRGDPEHSILGTGASSGLNTWITRMFKKYPYSRIGLRSCCKTISSRQGTIHDAERIPGGRGYSRGGCGQPESGERDQLQGHGGAHRAGVVIHGRASPDPSGVGISAPGPTKGGAQHRNAGRGERVLPHRRAL